MNWKRKPAQYSLTFVFIATDSQAGQFLNEARRIHAGMGPGSLGQLAAALWRIAVLHLAAKYL